MKFSFHVYFTKCYDNRIAKSYLLFSTVQRMSQLLVLRQELNPRFCDAGAMLQRWLTKASVVSVYLATHRKSVGSISSGGLIVDFFSQLYVLKFELCIIPLEIRTHRTFRIYPTSGEGPQNHYCFIK